MPSTILNITVRDGIKCPRCWHYHYYDGLCDRCCYVLLNNFPEHESVPEILKAYEQQKIKWTVITNKEKEKENE